MEPTVIYEIICVSGNPEVPNMFRHTNWGYYFDRRNAEKVIEENQTDISELGYYKYALLSEKKQGTLAISLGLQWYEFVWKKTSSIPWPKLLEVKKILPPAMYYKDMKYHRFLMKEDL